MGTGEGAGWGWEERKKEGGEVFVFHVSIISLKY